ncbi:MAG: hypothetical protein JNL64_11450 [Blastocatellia bacterium]|nr:hypothetical protein [Blastocatellia bacterium]
MLNVLLIALIATFPLIVVGQTKLDSVEQFIEDSESIFIAKAVEVGPVNIIAQSRVKLDILHVVKGDAEPNEAILTVRHRMRVGGYYLIGVSKTSNGRDGRETVIEFYEPDNLELVKTLSPRIVVLRTINIELGRLGSTLRSTQFEIERLSKIKGNN